MIATVLEIVVKVALVDVKPVASATAAGVASGAPAEIQQTRPSSVL